VLTHRCNSRNRKRR